MENKYMLRTVFESTDKFEEHPDSPPDHQQQFEDHPEKVVMPFYLGRLTSMQALDTILRNHEEKPQEKFDGLWRNGNHFLLDLLEPFHPPTENMSAENQRLYAQRREGIFVPDKDDEEHDYERTYKRTMKMTADRLQFFEKRMSELPEALRAGEFDKLKQYWLRLQMNLEGRNMNAPVPFDLAYTDEGEPTPMYNGIPHAPNDVSQPKPPPPDNGDDNTGRPLLDGAAVPASPDPIPVGEKPPGKRTRRADAGRAQHPP
ncbi:unnamed protein product [Amoebophrya sp. A120]|nr:unnamed protein product [Amoebophrya sp. A120]|eukprot:GSA120T00022952001.1